MKNYLVNSDFWEDHEEHTSVDFSEEHEERKRRFTDADFEWRDFTDADCRKNDEVLFWKSVLNYGGVLEE